MDERRSNTRRNGSSFDEGTVELVWQKGTKVADYDPAIYRQDCCGAWMQRSEYGNTDAQYGWEIDHIKPISAGGGDTLNNLQPLRWENNRHKADSYPNWSCAVGQR